MTKINELKHCPFCGKRNLVYDTEVYPKSIKFKIPGLLILVYFNKLKWDKRGFVQCVTKGCRGLAVGKTLEEAIKKWNSRTGANG